MKMEEEEEEEEERLVRLEKRFVPNVDFDDALQALGFYSDNY
jgi:predicted nucleic acid-binding protein